MKESPFVGLSLYKITILQLGMSGPISKEISATESCLVSQFFIYSLMCFFMAIIGLKCHVMLNFNVSKTDPIQEKINYLKEMRLFELRTLEK